MSGTGEPDVERSGDAEAPPSRQGPRASRRGLLGLAAGAVAGLVTGRLTSHDEAQAANGDPIAAGATTAATSKTTLSTSGAITNDGAFVVDAPNADYGLKSTGAEIGVYGSGPIGVLGEGAVGGVFSGTDTAISLTPTGTSGPPTSTQSLKGDVLVDADGVLWLCVADGTPGTWIRVSHGGIRLLDQPQRIYDSRLDLARGIMTENSTRTIDIIGANDVLGVPLAVPPQALGIVCNLTVTETSAGGFLQAWPEGERPREGSNLNWWPGWTLANSATVRLGSDGKIRLYVEASRAQVVIDVSGYIL
ncbi:MAG TPA: hypothetical protein VFB42_10730 [Gaiellaceae bacterium]|nr:hypothetical protein [Gaiellaceae bacterium]